MSSPFDRIIALSSAQACALIEHAAATADDMLNWIEIYRDGEPHLQFNYRMTPETEQVDAWAAQKLEPDVIVSIKEVWIPHVATNPLTGNIWGPGEVRDVRENHDGIANGWITEAVVNFAASRAGQTSVVAQPYIRADQTISWTEFDDDIHAIIQNLYGQVAGNLFGLMADTPPLDYGTPADRERGQAQLDLEAITRFTMNTDRVEGSPEAFIVAAKPGTPRHQALREYLQPGAITTFKAIWEARGIS